MKILGININFLLMFFSIVMGFVILVIILIIGVLFVFVLFVLFVVFVICIVKGFKWVFMAVIVIFLFSVFMGLMFFY